MAVLAFRARRLASIAISVSIVVVLTFYIINLAPGNFLEIQRVMEAAATQMRPDSAEWRETVRLFEQRYGLDKPIWQQALIYLKGAAQFKFGPSFHNVTMNIEELIRIKFRPSLVLATLAIGLAVLIGIPLGIVAALRKNTWVDYGAMSFSLVGVVVPNYVAGLVLVVVFAVYLGWLPTSGWGRPEQLILPVFTLALAPIATVAAYMRSSLLDTLGQDFIRTAHAKGLWEQLVIVRHALRNSLIPLVTVLGPLMAYYITVGTTLVETIFRIPGLGQLFIESAGRRDYPLIVTGAFLAATLVMLANLIVDIIYALLDPRIKLE